MTDIPDIQKASVQAALDRLMMLDAAQTRPVTPMTQEEWTQMMVGYVTPPPLNERVIIADDVGFVTEDDHGTVRFYTGQPLPGMPNRLD